MIVLLLKIECQCFTFLLFFLLSFNSFIGFPIKGFNPVLDPVVFGLDAELVVAKKIDMTPSCGEELSDEGLFFFCFSLDVEFIQDIAVVVMDDGCNKPCALVPDLHFNLTCSLELAVVQKRNGTIEAIIFFASIQGIGTARLNSAS